MIIDVNDEEITLLENCLRVRITKLKQIFNIENNTTEEIDMENINWLNEQIQFTKQLADKLGTIKNQTLTTSSY